MADAGLYQQIVLDHQRAPRNFGRLPQHTHTADGINALCGDTLHVELRCIDGRVAELRFSGECCAIATATASMLSERVQGMDVEAIATVASRFERIVRGELEEDATLGALNALGELKRYPARRKCALLPWATLQAALAGQHRTSTEIESA